MGLPLKLVYGSWIISLLHVNFPKTTLRILFCNIFCQAEVIIYLLHEIMLDINISMYLINVNNELSI